MKTLYVILPMKKVNHIVDLSKYIDPDCEAPIALLIEQNLEEPASQFHDHKIQADIAELVEKHNLDVR